MREGRFAMTDAASTGPTGGTQWVDPPSAPARPRHRTSATVLLAVGAFLIALGLFLRFYLAGQLVVVPTNQYSVVHLTDQHATYLDVPKLREVRDATVYDVQTVKGDVQASTHSTAIWDTFAATNAANGYPISYSQNRVAIDRRSSSLVTCCGARLGKDTSVNFSGYEFKFPFHTKKQTYPFFDTVLKHTVPMRYQGTDTVDGVAVYRFQSQVPDTAFKTMTVPGSFIGSKKPSVHAKRYYRDTRTYWVEPTSGIFVKVEDHHTEVFKDAAGNDHTIAFDGDMRSDPASVKHEADFAASTATEIKLVGWAPWILYLAGVICLGIAVALRVSGRDGRRTA